MTFKKSNKSAYPVRKKSSNRAQAIFEYFILTIAVVAIVLFFSSSQFFQDVKGQCGYTFNAAVEEILE